MEMYGDYQLLSKIATGGMAQVYLARQLGLDGFERLVVVKRILPHLAENPEFIAMFLREARLAARLSHPNIAQVYDLGRKGDSYFLAMEYVHGEDFRRVMKQAIREKRALPVPLAVRMVIGASEGLEFAHNQVDHNTNQPLGIVHRDVSPQNLLVTFDGAVKVIDFGIAKAMDGAPHTRTGVLKGKYAYMSPEQAEGRRVDKRSDVFALGVILHELLTGQRLFKKVTDLATLQAVAECKVPAPSSINPAVDPALDAIVLRALAKNRDRRTPSAGRFQEELEEFLRVNRLAGSSAQLRQFMREIYSDRLAREARLGRPWVEGESPVEEVFASSDPAAKAGFSPTPPSVTPRPAAVAVPVTEKATVTAAVGSADTVLVAIPSAAGPGVMPETQVSPRIERTPEPVERTAHLSSSAASTKAPARRRFGVDFMAVAAVLAAMLVGMGFMVLGVGRPSSPVARVRVQSEPDDAEIIIDGKPSGRRTPGAVELTAEQPHLLRLEKPGFRAAEESLAPFNGELVRSFTLRPSTTGAVRLSSVPTGALIAVDGRDTGRRTDAVVDDLGVGRVHEAVLSLEGYEDEVVVFSVEPQRVFEYARSLRPKAPGRKGGARAQEGAPVPLRVVSTPPGLALSVDGRSYGTTPSSLVLGEGRRRLRLTDPARRIDYETEVQVRASGTREFWVELVPQEIVFNVRPAADVYVGDVKISSSPGSAQLYPGSYRVTYRNAALGLDRTESLVVPLNPAGPVRVDIELPINGSAP